MGANASLEGSPRFDEDGSSLSAHRSSSVQKNPSIIMLPYFSMYRIRPLPNGYMPNLGRPDSPVSAYQFCTILNCCPLPRDIFRPFPPIDQAEGSVVKSFHCRPPGGCYSRRAAKFDPGFFYRVDVSFLPNDEARLIVSAGMYVDRPGLSVQRINTLFDGLVAQWTMGSGPDRCQLVKGSRSPDCHGFSLTSDGRLLAWPALGGIQIFDRYSAAVCGKSNFASGESTKAVAFALSNRYVAVVTSHYRQFRLRILTGLQSSGPLAALHLVSLTSIDPTFAMSNAYREHVTIRWSIDETTIAVGSSEGHLILVSRQQSGQPPVVIAPSFSTPPGWLETRLASVRAFDFAPWGHSQGRQVIGFAANHGRVHVYDIERMTVLASRNLFAPVSEPTERVRCLRFSNNGRLVALGMSDGQIRLLDAHSLEPVRDLEECLLQQPAGTGGAFSGVSSLSFSCTDRYLAAGASDGFIRVWCLDRRVDSLTRLAKRCIRAHLPLGYISKLPLPDVMRAFLQEQVY